MHVQFGISRSRSFLYNNDCFGATNEVQIIIVTIIIKYIRKNQKNYQQRFLTISHWLIIIDNDINNQLLVLQLT